MLIKLRYLICLIVVIVAFTTQANADKIERCLICGMDVSKYTHVKYVVTTTDGKQYITCGVQCGLTLHLRLKNEFQSATATDLISHKTIDAKKGFYVYKSSVITDMAPGFIAFKRRVNAEKFAKGFGGEVVTYEEALDMWKKTMK
jgi:nitrous oxide reductase accessory protein NosL